MPSALDQVRRQLAAFARFTARALVENDLEALLLDACIRARAGLSASHAKLLEYLPNEDKLLLRSGVGWKPGYVGVYRAPVDLRSGIGYAFNMGESVAICDYEAQSAYDWPELLKEHGCKSSLNVPLRGETGVFGVLEVDHREVRDYSDDDVHFLRGLANTVARAIELHRIQQAKDRALAANELLMQEMNHRIKNNLSIVASVLSLQARRLADPVMRREFDDAISRVLTLAHIHDRMHRQSSGARDASAFFNDFCSLLGALVPKNVVLKCRATGTLPDENLEALSLMVNEIVTNACKYAFPNDKAGTIEITYDSTPTGWLLRIHDDGIGLPAGFDAQGAKSFGIVLIRTFAAQLNASIQYASNGGTRVDIISPPSTLPPTTRG